jgi:hypothetical protein
LLIKSFFNVVLSQDSCEFEQEIKRHYLKKELYQDSLVFYHKLYGRTKRIDKKDQNLELAFYVALRYFPELENTKIRVHFKKIKATMMAQPDADFIIKSRNSRRYKIIINSTKDEIGMNYEDLSFNSLVGWIGHELAHITDYDKKSNGQLLQFISQYIFSKKHMKHTENSADKETVKRGLGYALYEGITDLVKNPKILKKYKEKKKEYYLSPKDILAEIKIQEQER